MNQMFNVAEVKSKLEKAAHRLHNDEKFLTGWLVGRAKKLALANPQDLTVADMYNFLEAKAEKSSFVTRAELQSAYSQLMKRADNQFAPAFAKELDKLEMTDHSAKKYASASIKNSEDGRDLLKEGQDKYSDPLLKNAFESLFTNKKLSSKMFSAKLGEQAVKSAEYQLKKIAWNVPTKIEAVSGNSSFIICRASVQTPRGQVFTLIPVKVANDSILFPETFINDVGTVELTHKNLTDHVLSFQGKSLSVNSDKVLDYLTKQASADPISDVQMAIIRMKAAENPGTEHYDSIGIVYKQAFLNATEKEVPKVQYQLPSALEPFAQSLGSQAGQADFLFGKQAVSSARSMIEGKLSRTGFSRANIKVAGVAPDAVVFAVSLVDKAFSVPVQVVDKVAQEPKMIVANGSLFPFSGAGIQTMLAEETDAQLMAVAHNVENDTPQALSDKIKYALFNGKTEDAEKLLYVLQEKDSGSFKDCMALYKSVLAGEKIAIAKPCGCDKLIRTSSSIHPLCGHTGLPANKIYQDKFGQCRPLYRRGFEEQETSITPFASSKVYW